MSTSEKKLTPLTQEQRVKNLNSKLKKLSEQKVEWTRKLSLAETNVNRIDGAISQLGEILEEEEAYIVSGKRDKTEPTGKALHDQKS